VTREACIAVKVPEHGYLTKSSDGFGRACDRGFRDADEIDETCIGLKVSEYFIDGHPAILRLIELVVRDAGDMPVSLCGEAAGRIEMIPRLLRAGVRSLSVSAALVPEAKDAVRQASC
jgi:phosphoenolpyruvate synthase/pyruvate phosphate dikinase